MRSKKSKKQRRSELHDEDVERVTSFLDIDPLALDKEWVTQPVLFEDWAAKSAKAKRKYEDAKTNLKIVEAELDKQIREDPEDFGFNGKPSEKAIEKAILLQDRWLRANDKLIAANYEVDILDAAVKALDQRKKALENLVFLHGQSYFSEPRAKDSNSKEVETDLRNKRVVERSRKRRK